MIDIRETLLSQYANSPNILAILKSANQSIDPRSHVEEFYNMAVNLYSAVGFGLDIWGKIVGIGRGLSIPDPDDNYFGFEGSEKYTPFGQAPFFGGNPGDVTYEMSDDTYREVIIIKAYSNILYATAPNINAFLKASFSRGKAYYLITGHMQARYVFEYRLSEFEKNLIFHHNILPQPSGVDVGVNELPTNEYFGFYGSGFQPFNQAPFTK